MARAAAIAAWITGLHEHALVVVLQHERVRLAHRAGHRGVERLDLGADEVRIDLLVHAHHLLPARHHARLGRRRARGADEAAGVRAQRLEHPLQLPARGIVAERCDEFGARPEGRGVLRDVGRSAERVLPFLHAHDGHRGLGGDPLDVPAEVDVEHRVPDDRDPQAAARRGLEEFQQAGAGDQVFRHDGKDA
ncbi:MAG: hypothetical protein IPJ78_14355 [Gemmatimonadetes bacterium]|nr:hypothetical protein [Gemmatimonadota bacterium]